MLFLTKNLRTSVWLNFGLTSTKLVYSCRYDLSLHTILQVHQLSSLNSKFAPLVDTLVLLLTEYVKIKIWHKIFTLNIE